MNLYLFDEIEELGDNEDEKQYACMVRFYVDPEINFYERERPMMTPFF
jgi:hypothetical protein